MEKSNQIRTVILSKDGSVPICSVLPVHRRKRENRHRVERVCIRRESPENAEKDVRVKNLIESFKTLNVCFT